MGTYYNPPGDIQKVGRKLEDEHDAEQGLFAQLQPDELLFSLVDVFARRHQPLTAGYIETMADYTELMKGKWQGHYKIIGFYAVPRESAEKGCGRTLPVRTE